MTGSTETAPAGTRSVPSRDPGDRRGLAVPEVIAAARTARAGGDRAAATGQLVSALRGGLWEHGALWVELVSLMEAPADYPRILALWWESPETCHHRLAIVRSVARAAGAAGEHDDARLLLRKAILLQARRQRRLRPRLGRLKRRVRGMLPAVGGGSVAPEVRAGAALADLNPRLDNPNVEVTDPDHLHTLLFFSLLDALGKGSARRRDRYRTLLRERGEGAWLGRL